jgi:hypothetical protein
VRKSDLKLDGLALAIVFRRRVGKGLVWPITAELRKIQEDARRTNGHFRDLQILVQFRRIVAIRPDVSSKFRRVRSK